jgi:hypothetical protein
MSSFLAQDVAREHLTNGRRVKRWSAAWPGAVFVEIQRLLSQAKLARISGRY